VVRKIISAAERQPFGELY
jgi:hypothetical protein